LAGFDESGFGFGLEHLAATVKAGRADMVTQVGLTGGGFHGNTGHHQGIMRTMHTALGRRLLVLLDGHNPLLVSGCAPLARHAGFVKVARVVHARSLKL